MNFSISKMVIFGRFSNIQTKRGPCVESEDNQRRLQHDNHRFVMGIRRSYHWGKRTKRDNWHNYTFGKHSRPFSISALSEHIVFLRVRQACGLLTNGENTGIAPSRSYVSNCDKHPKAIPLGQSCRSCVRGAPGSL